MGCCRGHAKPAPVQNGRPPCKILEQGGANVRFWTMNVQGRYGLYMRGEKGNFVDVAQFISNYGCNGPVARTVVNNLNRVLQAMNKNPGPFRDKAATGVSLVQILRTADTVLSPGRSPDGRKLHPFAPRRRNL
jgi:hypothetical protein